MGDMGSCSAGQITPFAKRRQKFTAKELNSPVGVLVKKALVDVGGELNIMRYE